MNGHGIQAALIRFAIRFRGVVIALAIVLLGYGAYMLQRAKYDVFPEFAPPQVSIQTEAPGLAAEQVEILVTQPLENSLNGALGVSTVRSASIQGLSVIVAMFDPGSDIYLDRQVIAEQLAVAAAQLPREVRPPTMTPLTSSTSTVLVAGLTSNQRSLMELRTAADWTIRPRLLAVPGVAKVSVFGGEVKTFQVQVHPDQLIRFGIGLNDVLNIAQRASGVRGAGFIETANQRFALQTEGQALTPEDLAHTVLVSKGGAAVMLGAVATVAAAPEPPIGGAAINGQTGVQLVISEQYGADTVAVTKRVEAALADLKPALQGDGIEIHADLFRPANFIETATANVQNSLILGGVLVIIVLFLFLFDLRTAAISAISIPLSLLAATIVLQRFGATLNTMTLGGLAIAIGVVVDDAVIDVENIARRLRENAALPQPRPAAKVILDACLEVRSAVVYATFAVILVVLPVLGLSGIAGRLFAPLGIAYILAVMASLVVALTVTPALSALLLTRSRLKPAEPPLMRWSKAGYTTLLQRIGRRPRSVIIAAVALTVLGCTALPFFGGAFLPELNEGHFIVHMSSVPGTSITESLRLGGLVTKALLALPEVRLVAQRVGRAEASEDTWGTHYSEIEVDLKPLDGQDAESVQSEMRNVLAQFPGVNFAIKPFLTERVEETLSGFTAPVAINVYGNDLDVLDGRAQEIARVLGGLPGATEVQVQSPPGMPQLSVRLRPADVQRWGFDPIDVLDLIRTAYQGDVVGQSYEGNRSFDITVMLDQQSRQSVTAVETLPLRTAEGTYVRLRQIADVFEKSGRYQVLHQGAQRLQTITTNVAGRDVTSFVQTAKEEIAKKVAFPSGTSLEFAGTAEAEAQSERDLLLNSAIAAVGIVLLLSIVTRNAANLLLVLVNLPFALVGAVLAVFASGGLLSLGSMVGFVTLFGITLRNSILMIAHYEHLVEVEKEPWTLATAIRGAADRLTPILMTSVVTALGVLPLAIGAGDPGREVEGPMAIVILGGLLTSMALNLLVLPILALRYGRFESQGKEIDMLQPHGAGTGG
jgi:CzcA family heavy metal efflux pump